MGQEKTRRDLAAPRLIALADVAARLGVSYRHVQRLLGRGELTRIRVGVRAVRVAEDDLRRFVTSRLERARQRAAKER